MKVWLGSRPFADVPSRAVAVELRPGAAVSPLPRKDVHVVSAPGELGFAALYDQWFDDVLRWLRALGAPSADSEDLAQEVFLVVRRRLHAFDGRNPAGWLYRIASRQVSAHRRRRWFRSVLARRPDIELDELPDAAVGPAGGASSRRTSSVSCSGCWRR